MLEIKDVKKEYAHGSKPVPVLHGVSYSVQSGEFVAVKGPSGCGKSTLLLIAGGLLAPDSGTVEIAGQNPYSLSVDERAKFRAEKIGFVFQNFHLVPYLNVLENVIAPSLAVPASETRERAMELIQRFGLESRIGHVPSRLSTGERQRTALARALLNKPKLVLADEPTGNLDHENAELVFEHLKEFVGDGGSVFMVTHDERAAGHANRVEQLDVANKVPVATMA